MTPEIHVTPHRPNRWRYVRRIGVPAALAGALIGSSAYLYHDAREHDDVTQPSPPLTNLGASPRRHEVAPPAEAQLLRQVRPDYTEAGPPVVVPSDQQIGHTALAHAASVHLAALRPPH